MNDPNSPPPLPPGGSNCPNCGTVQAKGAPYCSNCGASLATAQAPSTSKTVYSVLLAMAALGFGAYGGCIALIVVMGGASPRDNLTIYATGAIALLLAAACVWVIFRIQRRK